MLYMARKRSIREIDPALDVQGVDLTGEEQHTPIDKSIYREPPPQIVGLTERLNDLRSLTDKYVSNSLMKNYFQLCCDAVELCLENLISHPLNHIPRKTRSRIVPERFVPSTRRQTIAPPQTTSNIQTTRGGGFLAWFKKQREGWKTRREQTTMAAEEESQRLREIQQKGCLSEEQDQTIQKCKGYWYYFRNMSHCNKHKNASKGITAICNKYFFKITSNLLTLIRSLKRIIVDQNLRKLTKQVGQLEEYITAANQTTYPTYIQKIQSLIITMVADKLPPEKRVQLEQQVLELDAEDEAEAEAEEQLPIHPLEPDRIPSPVTFPVEMIIDDPRFEDNQVDELEPPIHLEEPGRQSPPVTVAAEMTSDSSRLEEKQEEQPIHKLEQEVTESKVQLAHLEEELRELQQEMEELFASLNQMETKYRDAELEHAKILEVDLKTTDQLRNEEKKLQRQLEARTDMFHLIEKQIEKLEEKLRKGHVVKNPTKKIEEIQKEIETIRQNTETTQKELKDCESQLREETSRARGTRRSTRSRRNKKRAPKGNPITKKLKKIRKTRKN